MKRKNAQVALFQRKCFDHERTEPQHAELSRKGLLHVTDKTLELRPPLNFDLF